MNSLLHYSQTQWRIFEVVANVQCQPTQQIRVKTTKNCIRCRDCS
jgi:hypothetical protein